MEIVEGLLRFFDKLVAFFLLVYSAGDLVDLIPPWDLPVRGTVWLNGSWGDVIKRLLRLRVYGRVHRNDLVRISGGDLLQDFSSESIGSTVNHFRLVVAELFGSPWADARRINISLSTPGRYEDWLDAKGKQGIAVSQANCGDALVPGALIF